MGQKVGVAQGIVTRWETDKQLPRPDKVVLLAQLAGETPLQFMGQTDIPASAMPGRKVDVITSVAAGSWQPSVEWEDDDRYAVPAILPNKWDNVTIYGAEVQGDSMNRYYPDGSIVFFAPLNAIPGGLKSGMHVIVVRNDHGEYETTIKEYVVDDETGQRWLWPRSSSPEHQSPVAYNDRRGSEVTIKGVVVSSFVLAPGMRAH